MALKDDFIKGRALRSISAAWLNGVARALNSLSIRFDKNAKSPRIEKPPMPGGRSAWTIVLPPYPEAGAGGGGDTEDVLTLGPMEYISTPTAQFVQYMGKWSFSESNSAGDGEWVFTRATNADGTERPPAKVYPASIAQMLVRGSPGSSGADVISVVNVPVLHAGTPGVWLQRQTVSVAKSVDYSAPSSELDAGYLTKTSTTITYFESMAASTGTPEVILSTITEDANEATTYESSDSGSSSDGSEE